MAKKKPKGFPPQKGDIWNDGSYLVRVKKVRGKRVKCFVSKLHWRKLKSFRDGKLSWRDGKYVG